MSEAEVTTRSVVWMLLRRLLIIVLVIAVLLYLALAGLLYSKQRSLLYFPTRAAAVEAPSFSVTSNGLTLHGWAVNPGKPRALLYFGGNGEAVERNADFFRSTLPEITVYLIPYRGYSGNPGMPTEKDLYADALIEFDRIRVDHAQVVVMGRSLGSGVATYVAAHRPVHRLVLVTPYDSIAKVAQGKYPLFPIGLLLKDKYESWRRAPALAMPTLVLIAAKDRVIPRGNSDALVASFTQRPEVVVVPEAGHNDISAQADYSSALEAFLAD
ncbi:alpha/beta hydrolase [Arenimonas oryziterrae]|uniref:Alpha/beta hydrolase n=1 Tax=Arenimonas oryziterrae DSM 21050 = YC6267 TaxID=1121015 RepID=A0A091AQ59_9GAMM|nr:alpha/beta hydrolase [Arenimonas oryziterrae]KFN41144.1 hypothetical protein N789_04460 [Arenimonas oryziterrae DSM 21050 = YC6267]